MTEQVTWTCDGCDKESLRSVNGDMKARDDFKEVRVELRGFSGFPLGANADHATYYHLCPHCRRRLYENSNPKVWPRAAQDRDQ